MTARDLLSGPPTPGSTARQLLRSLRDLDLGQRVALTRDRAVRIAGCTSRDEPVERGVRYRLQHADGSVDTLSMQWVAGALEIQVHGGSRWRRLRSALRLDALGRTSAPDLGARLDPRATGTRSVERFMRRVVRATYAA